MASLWSIQIIILVFWYSRIPDSSTKRQSSLQVTNAYHQRISCWSTAMKEQRYQLCSRPVDNNNSSLWTTSFALFLLCCKSCFGYKSIIYSNISRLVPSYTIIIGCNTVLQVKRSTLFKGEHLGGYSGTFYQGKQWANGNKGRRHAA